jgi:hypothetical protein
MNFDLDIKNYSRDELIQMFELPSDFDRNIVEIKEAKLKESITKNIEINKDTQMKTLNFLIKAKNIILNGNNKKDDSEKPIDENKQYDPRYKSYYELEPTSLEDNSSQHPIQVRYEKPHVSSYPSEYYPGVINPLKKRLVRKNLVIDTRFRDNYYNSTSSNFSFILPTNFNDVLEMQLSSVEFPCSYYAISKQYGNNYFTLTVTPTGGTPQSAVITIPDGNYDQFSVIAAINTSLIATTGPFDLITFNVDLNVGTASKTLIGSGKTLVGPVNLNTVQSYELNFQNNELGVPDQSTPLPLKFGWMLGFRNGIYSNNLNYVSEGVVDVSGAKYVYLVLDDYNNSVVKNFYSALNSSVLNNNILARFPIATGYPFGLYVENSLASTSAPPRAYFGPVNINNLTIQLLDEYGRIINLNNMDYSIGLTLTSIYDL